MMCLLRTLLLALIGLGVSLLGSACRSDDDEGADRGTNASHDAAILVGGVPLDAELEHALERTVERMGRTLSPAERAACIDDLVRTELLVRRARHEGIDTDPELVATWRRLLAERYVERELARRRRAIRVSEVDIARAHHARSELYRVPASARVAVLVLELPRGAATERVDAEMARAGRFRAEVATAFADADDAARDAFTKLVREHSADRASRYIGGDQGWIPAEPGAFRWGERVRAAALALDAPGAVSAPVRTEQGVVLAQLLERRPARERPLAEVREEIRHRLLAEAEERVVASFETELRRDVEIAIDPERVEALFHERGSEERVSAEHAAARPLAGRAPARRAPAGTRRNTETEER